MRRQSQWWSGVALMSLIAAGCTAGADIPSSPATLRPTTGVATERPSPFATPTPTLIPTDPYVSERYGYSIVAPGGWRATPSGDDVWQTGQVFSILEAHLFDRLQSDDLDTSLFIAWQELAAQATLDEWATFSNENMQRPIHECSDPIPERDEETTLDGEPARLLGFLCHGSRLHSWQLVAVHDDRGYMLGLWGPPRDAEEDRGIVLEAVSTFRFGD